MSIKEYRYRDIYLVLLKIGNPILCYEVVEVFDHEWWGIDHYLKIEFDLENDLVDGICFKQTRNIKVNAQEFICFKNTLVTVNEISDEEFRKLIPNTIHGNYKEFEDPFI